MRLKSLAHTSRAQLDMSDGDMTAIHQSARHYNALDGVTGLLMFDGVRFLQIIEGAEDAIDSLVERLRRDPRHSSFEVRDERFVEDQSFTDWSMNMVRLSTGFGGARAEITRMLPEDTSPDVRDLLFRMTDEMAVQP